MCEQKLQWQLLLLVFGDKKKCTIVTLREELKIYLKNHSISKESLDGSTIRNNGYGFIEQMESCTKMFNILKVNKEKIIVLELQLKQNVFKRCTKIYHLLRIMNVCHIQVIMNLNYIDYTTNKIHCLKRRLCSDAQKKIFCLSDAQDNKCEYHQNQCKIKSCDTALNQFSYYQNGSETFNGYTFEINCN
ncbi:unnamed protein product [Paramecium pentaurelia]|uniref:Uncharacterized protein n=1 Tax=Paramecium pentaurelia TaxID=43138 RepID=A0A8S1TKC7_9CILI|nr:unnamed protein product [Paramecium pentaurelia]